MYRLWKLTGSSDQNARIIAIPSSSRRPRSSNGTPSAANSSFNQPDPAPRINRPSEKFCSVASSLANRNGCRIGSTSTVVPSRTKLFRESARGAKTGRAELRKAFAKPDESGESIGHPSLR